MTKEVFDAEIAVASLDGHLTINESGAIETVKDEAFNAFLEKHGNGKTLSDVVETQQVVSNFIDTLALAAGRKSIALLKDNKELDKTEGKVRVGNDRVKFSLSRSSEVSDGKGGRKVKHGTTSLAYLVSGGASTGSMKKIRDTLSEEAAKALA